MLKNKRILLIVILSVALFLIPNICNAQEVSVKRNIYSIDGSMKFTFTGLTINATHEYEYGFTKTAATAVENWYLVTESTSTSATATIMVGTKEMRNVINAVDTGYITIKDKTTDTVVLEPYAVDLKLPFLRVTNYEVISNGQNLDGDYEINVPLRNASNSEAYYKYEKITDQNLIKKYKEIKANSGDYTALESLLKTSAPASGYSTWAYWNGHGSDGRNGFGYTTRTVNVPDEGLYYLWVYFSGENVKNLYGCIIVDNLQPDIAVDAISLPATKTVELGRNITLYPTFNPSTATNKIVTWTSSDETIATVDNAGKITPKKVGSTIITVITQDGNKKATCTVTVTSSEGNNSNEDNQNKEQEAKVTLSSIKVTKTSTKNTYSEGESFDKSGMVVKAIYSDGTEKEITNYAISPSGALKATDTKVYITYTENGVTKAVEQEVTVTPKLIINNNNNGSEDSKDSKDSNYKDDTEKDTTIKNDNKLPQTGVTVIFLAIIALIVVSIISKVKCIKYKDI